MVCDGLHGLRRRTPDSGHRSHIDNLAAFLLEHDSTRGLGAQKSAGQIGFDHLVPFGQCHFFCGNSPGDTGVVDKDVDLFEFGNRGRDQLLNAGLVLYVTGHGQSANTEFFQIVRSFFAALFLARAQDQVGAHLSQGFRHLAAQPYRSAGNNGHAAGQIEKLLYTLGRGLSGHRRESPRWNLESTTNFSGRRRWAGGWRPLPTAP
jgi:hypothetical protein